MINVSFGSCKNIQYCDILAINWQIFTQVRLQLKFDLVCVSRKINRTAEIWISKIIK